MPDCISSQRDEPNVSATGSIPQSIFLLSAPQTERIGLDCRACSCISLPWCVPAVFIDLQRDAYVEFRRTFTPSTFPFLPFLRSHLMLQSKIDPFKPNRSLHACAIRATPRMILAETRSGGIDPSAAASRRKSACSCVVQALQRPASQPGLWQDTRQMGASRLIGAVADPCRAAANNTHYTLLQPSPGEVVKSRNDGQIIATSECNLKLHRWRCEHSDSVMDFFFRHDCITKHKLRRRPWLMSVFVCVMALLLRSERLLVERQRDGDGNYNETRRERGETAIEIAF